MARITPSRDALGYGLTYTPTTGGLAGGGAGGRRAPGGFVDPTRPVGRPIAGSRPGTMPFGTTTPAPAAAPAAPVAAPALPGAAAPPALPTWAQLGLDYLTSQQTQATQQSQATGNWLAGALGPLAAAGAGAQGQYQAQMSNLGGIYGAAGALAPPQVTSPSGGLPVGSPLAYLTAAGQDAATARGQAAQGDAAVRGLLAGSQPRDLATALLGSQAAYEASLPTQFADKRLAYLQQIGPQIEQLARDDRNFAYGQTKDQRDFLEQHRQWGTGVRENRRLFDVSAANSARAAELGLLGDVAAAGADTQQLQLTLQNQRDLQTQRLGSQERQTAARLTTQQAIAQAKAATAANKAFTPALIASMDGRWTGARPPRLGAGWSPPQRDPGSGAWYARRTGSDAGPRTGPGSTNYASLLRSSSDYARTLWEGRRITRPASDQDIEDYRQQYGKNPSWAVGDSISVYEGQHDAQEVYSSLIARGLGQADARRVTRQITGAAPVPHTGF